jgi:hypothetical protein
LGVGYAALPLHRILYLVTDEVAGAPAEPPPELAQVFLGVKWGGPAKFRATPIADILGWRERLAEKYWSQLGEILTWDEESDFEAAEDTSTSADVQFQYLAALVDERGPEVSLDLVGAPKPSHEEFERTFIAVERRGFTSRFPQLLLGAMHWLPFERNLIIEEPDWRGKVRRFGSTERLIEEITELRDLIAQTDPRATDWNPDQQPEDILGAAWQASETVARIGAIAVTKRLPLWTTG